MSKLVGCIEAGGTKFICAIGTGADDIRAEVRFPTTTPEETLGQAVAFFKEQQAELGPVAAIGIASFGPVDLNPDSPTYGYITTTPKPGWAHTDVVGAIKAELDVPVAFDTDVNGAAFGEYKWGAGQGLNTFVYFTIGTGIGGGGMVGGQLMHGLLHPEMGHMMVPHDLTEDPYPGHCPFHKDCLEGLACGPAIEERWQTDAANLPEDHKAWDLQAKYLGYLCVNTTLMLSPQRIILGGGVMAQPHLFAKIRSKTQELLNGYVQTPELQDNIDNYIVSPGLGDKAGRLGAIALAQALI